MLQAIQNDWTNKKIKLIIDYYGYKFFHGKKILDLGCGKGESAIALSRLGADVLCVDARQENLDFIKERYPNLKTQKVDLESEWNFNSYFHMTLSLDPLCHLKNYEDHLKNICSISENVVLETEVLDSKDISIRVPIYEEKSIHDLSYSGEGSIISSYNIQNKLSKLGATYKRLDETKLNVGPYRYDWHETNSGRKFGNRRLWFIRRDKYMLQISINQENVKRAEQGIVNSPTIQPEPIKETIVIQEKEFNKIVEQEKIETNKDSYNHIFYHNVRKIENIAPIRLFFPYFEGLNDGLKKKLDFCLKKNSENKNLNVVVLDIALNTTWNHLFQKINSISNSNDINILCNAAIFFDDTIIYSKYIQNKEVFSLNTWNYSENPSPNDNINNQNVFIFRDKFDINADFSIVDTNSDSRLNYEFHKSGYEIINPSKSIKAFNCQNFTQKNVITGPYLYVIPTEII